MPADQVLLLGTCDTKLSELLYVRSHIIKNGAGVVLMDVGRHPTGDTHIVISQKNLLSKLPDQAPDVTVMDRGAAIKTLASAATLYTKELYAEGRIAGAICIGGSGGTSLGAAVMRDALPIGFPKLIVSTVTSGDVSNFIRESDITMMNSVVDIAGQNSILNPILENAAGMIAGAAKAFQARLEMASSHDAGRRKCVAITMFGVTTPAADVVRQTLEQQGFEVVVFHATGQGGRAMENLIMQDRFGGVLDLTTTELSDEMVGGIMKGGPDRLTAASKKGIPQVICLGAQEIVNFGPKSSVPEKFRERAWYEHNPDITLMRTTKEESQALGRLVVDKLLTHAARKDLVKVWLPIEGLSMISTPGGPFADQEADTALFHAVEKGLWGSGIDVFKLKVDINNIDFARQAAINLAMMIG